MEIIGEITLKETQADASTIDFLQKNILSKVDTPLSNQIKNNLKLLKGSAIEYINTVETLQEKITKFEQLLRHQKKLRRSVSNYRNLEEYIQGRNKVRAFLDSDTPKKLYQKSMNFQQILNQFLGQQVKMIFVFENSEGEPELYEITSEDVLKYDYSSSNSLVARYRKDSDALNHSMKRLQLTTNWNFNFPGLKATYIETLYRYRCSRQVKKRIVLWENPLGRWHAMKVSAEGDINEAYASLVLLNRKEPTFNNSLEINIQQFLNQVAQVDNISGLLQGDVTDGEIQYGIKSAGASTLSLKQIIKIAHQIIEDEDFSKEKLEKIKQDFASKGKTRNKIQKSISKDVLDAIKQKIENNR